jgi:hypothetical protein
MNNFYFSFEDITLSSVVKQIKKFLIHSISYKFINIGLERFSIKITNIINSCIKNSTFPSKMKNEIIKPIYKAGCHKSIQNYRPISILPNLSKVFERHLANNIKDYIYSNNLLYNRQYGFRTNHSTSTCFLDLVNAISNCLDRGNNCIVIFLDMSKAFDLVCHKILLSKLANQFFFSESSVLLINSCLSKQMQATKIDSSLSEFQQLSCGVPQGSILGPLLFSIMINDIAKLPLLSQLYLYADDITLIL